MRYTLLGHSGLRVSEVALGTMGGNHRKSLVQSLEASLRRLRTDHVDILWLHAWDYLTPPEEVMRALDDQVRLGKVLYLGVSDTPAWVAAQLQTLAAGRGWSTFAGLQVEYSLVQRDVERELIPMARGLGLGVLAWGPLGAGVLSGKYAHPDAPAAGRRMADVDPGRLAIARVLADVADGLGLSSSVAALAWLRARGGVIPILGARTARQLADNLTCLDVSLPAEALAQLDQASHVARGFPHDFLASADFIFGGMSDQLDLPPGRSVPG
jgi:aryl-alcohol dehydrogenase-like predicted oxidoreductase